jgi:hypothetical protein
MECTTIGYPKKCMMMFSEVHSGEMMCVRLIALAKDLGLVMKCTTNGYPKQCMMRVSEVYSGEMMCVRPNTLAKDLELRWNAQQTVIPSNA